MKEGKVDPDGIRVFIPESTEEKESRDRRIQHAKHLKQVRKMIGLGIFSFFFILWLFSQNGRYKPNNDGTLIIDTRTGAVFDYEGNWIGSKDKKIVKIERVEMGFWPYFGFWKVKTQQ